MYKKIMEYKINCIYYGFSVGHDGSITYRKKIAISIEIVEKKDNENIA